MCAVKVVPGTEESRAPGFITCVDGSRYVASLYLCTSYPAVRANYALRLETTRYLLCVRLHGSGMRPGVYCLLLRIGIPNKNHDDTEHINDTMNLADGYRLRTDDLLRATCIGGVCATAIRVISNIEYTRSISTARITANNIAVRTVRVCTSSLYIDPACIGPHIVETSKKIVPAENQSNIKADDRVSTNI